MNDCSAIPFHLADELWLMIIDRVSALDWKQLRRTCRRLKQLTTPLLFQRVYFKLCGRGCDSLHNISCNRSLSACIQTLVLRRVRGYREFPDFNTWAASTHQPGDPGNELALPNDTSHYNNKQISDGLLPYTEWVALSKNEKEAFYREYEVDRKQAQKEVRDITNTLRFWTPSATEWALVHPHRAFGSTAADAAVEQFCKALETLPNLKALEHEPGFLYDDDWACQWRNLYFHPSSVICDTDYREDEDVEALQLSVVLHSLAWARRGDRGLKKLSMYVGGPAFATPERLHLLWDGNGHEITRMCRSLYPNAAVADKEAYSNEVAYGQSQLFYRQLSLMRYALAGLTHFDYVVSDEDDLVGSLEIAAKLVFGFLTAMKGLERLRLVFGRLVDGILLPLSQYTERHCARDSIQLLDQLTRHSPWNRIRDIELEIATDRTSLVKFLLAHKDTLRSLTFTRMSLVRLGDPLNTWEITLAEIAQGLSLSSLTLSKLCDFPQEWRRGVRERMLFDSEAAIWQGRISEYHAYHDAAVGRILRREGGHSLDPKASKDQMAEEVM
ncbi:F-box-like domain containing protein, partial [Pyrenophora tritici-repentis]